MAKYICPQQVEYICFRQYCLPSLFFFTRNARPNPPSPNILLTVKSEKINSYMSGACVVLVPDLTHYHMPRECAWFCALPRLHESHSPIQDASALNTSCLKRDLWIEYQVTFSNCPSFLLIWTISTQWFLFPEMSTHVIFHEKFKMQMCRGSVRE